MKFMALVNQILQGKLQRNTHSIITEVKIPHVVMGGIENFLSWLLKDKIPRYHGILPCSDFYILINILQRNLHFMTSCNY